MKKFLAILCLISALCATLVFAGCDYSWQPPDYPDYVVDESGHHIANIDRAAFIPVQDAPKTFVDVRDFGASPDASADDNTAAIQAAIDQGSASGEAVLVTGGVYFTHTLRMRDDTKLFLAQGSGLSMPDYDDYDASRTDGALILAKGVDNWTICGGGTLCGRGTEYTNEADDPTLCKPLETFALKEYVLQMRARIRDRKSVGFNVIYAVDCNDVALSGFEIYESSHWTVRLQNCKNVAVSNLVIDNNIHVANSDGIDICGGENITIDNCFIATGDDGIVLKSDTGAIKNVAVSNCSIFSLANNFKIGTETVHDISNVAVTDCHFFKADTAGGYAGIAIESADGANVANVAVSNIVMDGVTSPLLVWLGCRLDNGNTSRRPGSVANITVLNVKATDVDIASAIVGCNYDGTVFNVGNVVLDNFDITYRDCAETLDIYQGDSVLDANMNGYPEITRVSHRYFISHEMSEYYDIPYYGLYVDKAQNVSVTNFAATPRTCNTRAMANIPVQGSI